MKKIFIILICLFLIGCTSTEYIYVYPELPDYNPIKPEAPILEELSGDTVEDMLYIVIKNDIKRDTYIQQLEDYSTGWEDFYSEVQTIFKEKQVN